MTYDGARVLFGFISCFGIVIGMAVFAGDYNSTRRWWQKNRQAGRVVVGIASVVCWTFFCWMIPAGHGPIFDWV